MRVHILVGLPLLFCAAVEEDCTSSLVIEVFDDSDELCADVVLLHDCPQNYMPNPVKSLLEVYEDMSSSSEGAIRLFVDTLSLGYCKGNDNLVRLKVHTPHQRKTAVRSEHAEG